MDKGSGRFGEEYAQKRLVDEGYKIEASNFHTKYGEIDIVASKGEYIAFVEVKTRSRGFLYYPALAVNKSKQQKIIRSAYIYLEKNTSELQPRFDVITVIIADKNKYSVLNYEHLENCFGL